MEWALLEELEARLCSLIALGLYSGHSPWNEFINEGNFLNSRKIHVLLSCLPEHQQPQTNHTFPNMKISSLAGCWSSPTQPDAGIHCFLAGNARLLPCTGWVESVKKGKAASGFVKRKVMRLDVITEGFGRSGVGCEQRVGSALSCPAIYAIVRRMQVSVRGGSVSMNEL